MQLCTFSLLAILLGGCTPTDSGDTGKDAETDADGDGITAAEDCDDEDASAYPGANESCDLVDNDCDGEVDEADAVDATTFYPDVDGDTYGDAASAMTACVAPAGTVSDSADCDDGDAAVNPGATEACNNTDDDCDGEIDDGLDFVDYYPDGDGDGYGDDSELTSACADPGGLTTVGGDCDDTDAGVNPDAVERCDADDIDEDCDGDADDDDNSVSETLVYYMDMDGDGYGLSTMSTDACDAPAGYVREGDDCDDDDDAVNPGATELCDDADVDEDCDGSADDEDDAPTGTTTFYFDTDLDGYGVEDTTLDACDLPDGFAAEAGDCDDAEVTVNPGGTEVCDDADFDEDCDGLVDDADDSVTGSTTWYVDADGDGSGDDDMMLDSCDMPDGYVDNDDDPWEDAVSATVLDSGALAEIADLVVGSSMIWAVGADDDGDGIVVSIDPSTGDVTEVWAGEPLAYPTGIALSADESTLYIADIAAESADSGVNGAVYAVPVGGGSYTELGTAGIVDLPVDVAAAPDGSVLYVTGLNTDGDAAVFEVDPDGAGATEVYSGAPLVDPLSIAVSPHGSVAFVVDSAADRGRGALWSFSTSSWVAADELATGFGVAFPGGLAIDASGDVAFFTTLNQGDVVAAWTDGGGTDAVGDISGSIPGAVAVDGELLYVSDLTGSPDLYSFSY